MFLRKGESFVAAQDCEIEVIPQSLLTTNAYKALVFAIRMELFERFGKSISFNEIHFFNCKQIAPFPKILITKNSELVFVFKENINIDTWTPQECLYFYHKTIELWHEYEINLF